MNQPDLFEQLTTAPPAQEPQSITGSARFSDDRNYRYYLFRKWDDSKPFLMFIGLNPSTANETQDDPTIRRVIRFARDNGYGGIYMCNLFAIVSTDPKMLVGHADAVGDNDQWLRFCSDLCGGNVLFAWGNFKESKKRAEYVASMFPKAVCLGNNKDGSPKHPLYVPAAQPMIQFK